MLDAQPRLTPDQVAKIAREHFGFDGSPTPLPSERDQNVRIDAPNGRIVVKIANATEQRATLEAQQAAIRHLASRGAPVPSVVRTGNGKSLIEINDQGRTHLVWAITWIDGVTIASAR